MTVSGTRMDIVSSLTSLKNVLAGTLESFDKAGHYCRLSLREKRSGVDLAVDLEEIMIATRGKLSYAFCTCVGGSYEMVGRLGLSGVPCGDSSTC
jgi:hypothetical protein